MPRMDNCMVLMCSRERCLVVVLLMILNVFEACNVNLANCMNVLDQYDDATAVHLNVSKSTPINLLTLMH